MTDKAKALGEQPAIPFAFESNPKHGLTKRELFAAMIMANLSPMAAQKAFEFGLEGNTKEDAAEGSVKAAEALLEELAKD